MATVKRLKAVKKKKRKVDKLWVDPEDNFNS